MPVTISRRQRLLELGGVALTAVIFLLLPKPPATIVPLAVFIPLCMAAWGTWGALRLRRTPQLLRTWGLDPRVGLAALMKRVQALLVVGFLVCGAIGVAQGHDLTPPWMLLSFVLYPLWGLVQQWLVQALVVDHVAALTGWSLPRLMALGAVGFGAVHVEHPLLVVATGILGALYVAWFQRFRNLWPLALAHGWLGSVFYPWVLGRNPIEELIGLLPG